MYFIGVMVEVYGFPYYWARDVYLEYTRTLVAPWEVLNVLYSQDSAVQCVNFNLHVFVTYAMGHYRIPTDGIKILLLWDISSIMIFKPITGCMY